MIKRFPWIEGLVIVDSTFEVQSHFWFWIMEYKPEYFMHKDYRIENNKLTTGNYLKEYALNRKNKVVKRLSGVVLKLS